MVWFGASNFWQRLALFKQKHTSRNTVNLACCLCASSERAPGFEGQCALKAVLLGTKPTWNVFISIHANILQCLALASFTKTVVRRFHEPVPFQTCDKPLFSRCRWLFCMSEKVSILAWGCVVYSFKEF